LLRTTFLISEKGALDTPSKLEDKSVRVSSNNRGIKDVLYSVADLNVSGIL
jgi:hypothetical protein